LPVRERYEAPGAISDGQRECARATWCKSYTLETEDGQTVRRGALGYRAFCDRDRADIARCLNEIPAQYLWLRSEIGKPSRRGRPVRVPFGPRIPLRVDIDALQALMSESLCSWHERVADVARLDFPGTQMSRQRRGAWAVKRAADILDAHLDALLALEPMPVLRAYDLRAVAGLPDDTPGIVHAAFAEIHLDMDGADAGMEILHLHYLGRSVLGETKPPPDELPGVPCRADGCGVRALVRAEPPSDPDDKGDWSECLICGDRMTEDEYGDWTALCAAYERNQIRTPAVLENLPGVA
jgi:hypothetical protein